MPNIPPDQLKMNEYYKGRIESFANYHYKDIALIGDSLTAMGDWDRLLGRPVLNFGIKSDNSVSLLRRLNQVIGVRPKICFVLIGTNQYKNQYLMGDLREIVKRLSEAGVKVIFTTIPYTAENDTEYVRNNFDIGKFNKQMSGDYPNIIDLCKATEANKQLADKFSLDGVHLNEEGYLVWAKLIKQYLKEHSL